MEEELLQHLINLLRHSHAIQFKIPSQFFNERYQEWKASQEVQKAWIYIQKDIDLQLYKEIEEEGIITVKITVKKSKGEKNYGHHSN